MVLIQNLSYSLYFIYFLIKSFIPIKSEMKIFPDHISSGDQYSILLKYIPQQMKDLFIN